MNHPELYVVFWFTWTGSTQVQTRPSKQESISSPRFVMISQDQLIRIQVQMLMILDSKLSLVLSILE